MTKKDKIVFFMEVVRGGLRPATALDEEMLSRYRIGSRIEVTLHQGKNNDLLRKFWGFCSFVCDATDRWPNKEAMAAALLTELGYIANYTALRGGDILTHPQSISEMEAPVFNEFCERAFNLVRDEVGIDIGDFTAFRPKR